MRQVILDFPKQFKIGLEKARNIDLRGKFDNVVICGVGGSALPGSLLLDCFPNLRIPIYIHRNYGLPQAASGKSLIICISFSGNTEETFSGYAEAVKRGLKPVAITTGGKLQKAAKNKGLPVVVIPNDCLQPRMGTGYLFSALIGILANSGLAGLNTAEIASLAKTLKPEKQEKQGWALAKKLVAKIPIVYGSASYKAVARIWKIKFNENSKAMAFWNYFPELNHNEMVGLANSKSQISNCKYHFLILKDEEDKPPILKRMELTAKIIKESGAEIEIIKMPGKNKLEKIFNSLVLADWTSYYLALERNLDPVSVKIVEEFKKRLAG